MITIFSSVFNAESYLNNFLNYINSQLLMSFEVIFIDANSTDNTLQIIENFKFRNDINIKIIKSAKKINIYEAWNIGILNSSNHWVMNFNADDKLFPSALNTYAEYIKYNKHVDCIYSNCFISSDKNHGSLIDIKIWDDANSIDNLIKGSCVGPFPLLKKSAVIQAGLFDEGFNVAGDYEMWSRMKILGYKFLKIDEFIGTYFLNPSGVSTDQNNENLKNLYKQNRMIKMSLQNNKNFLNRFYKAIIRSIKFVFNEFKYL